MCIILYWSFGNEGQVKYSYQISLEGNKNETMLENRKDTTIQIMVYRQLFFLIKLFGYKMKMLYLSIIIIYVLQT